MYSKRVKKLSKKNRKSRKSRKSRKVQKGGKVTDYTKILHSEDLEVLDKDPLVASRMKNFREAYLGLFVQLNNLLKNVNSSNYEIGNLFSTEEKGLINEMYLFLHEDNHLINLDVISAVLNSMPDDEAYRDKQRAIGKIKSAAAYYNNITDKSIDYRRSIASMFWSVVTQYDKTLYTDDDDNIIMNIFNKLKNPESDIFHHTYKLQKTIENIIDAYTTNGDIFNAAIEDETKKKYSVDTIKRDCDILFKMLLQFIKYLEANYERYEIKKKILSNTRTINYKCSAIFEILDTINKSIYAIKKGSFNLTPLVITYFAKLYEELDDKEFFGKHNEYLYESSYNDMKYCDYTVNIGPSKKSPKLSFNHIKNILELLETYSKNILFIFDVNDNMTPKEAYVSLSTNASLFENILVDFANRSENIGTLNTTGFMHNEDLNKTISEISSKIGYENNSIKSLFNIGSEFQVR